MFTRKITLFFHFFLSTGHKMPEIFIILCILKKHCNVKNFPIFLRSGSHQDLRKIALAP